MNVQKPLAIDSGCQHQREASCSQRSSKTLIRISLAAVVCCVLKSPLIPE